MTNKRAMVNHTMAYPHKECSQEGELYTLTWKNVFDILLKGKKQVPVCLARTIIAHVYTCMNTEKDLDPHPTN